METNFKKFQFSVNFPTPDEDFWRVQPFTNPRGTFSDTNKEDDIRKQQSLAALVLDIGKAWHSLIFMNHDISFKWFKFVKIKWILNTLIDYFFRLWKKYWRRIFRGRRAKNFWTADFMSYKWYRFCLKCLAFLWQSP